MQNFDSGKLLRLSCLAAFCLGAPAGSSAAGIPLRLKPGFWQASFTVSMSMTMDGQNESEPDRTSSMVLCSDGSLGTSEADDMGGENGCSAGSSSWSGNTLKIVSVCPGYFGVGGALTTRETLVFESDTAMHLDGSGGSSIMNLHWAGDWKWLGSCPAGVTPGETGQMVGGRFESGSNMLGMQPSSP